MTLPELAIRRHVTTLMILVSLVVLGSIAVTRLPLAFLPNMDDPELHVRVPYPGSSPERVKHLILRPLEDALASVAGVQQMRSWASQDGCSVNLEFDWSENLALRQVEVIERIDRIRGELPEDIGDISVGEDWNNDEVEDPVLEARIGSELDLNESYDTLERNIVRPLERVPGVAQVRLDGLEPQEVHINLRLPDLELHSLTAPEVFRVIQGSNSDLSIGRVTDSKTRYHVRVLGALTDLEAIENLVLRGDGLLLKHVADITYDQPARDFGRHLDGKFAIGISVSAESSANTVAVCDRLEERIAQLEQEGRLTGISILEYVNQGKEIKRTLAELVFSGIFGAALASVVLFLFLRRLSTTLVSVLCIPFSVIVTCGIIWFQGKTLNTLMLLGLIVGIGMLVDNAVVVIENIFRHQEAGHDQKTAARLGSREVSTAIIAATLTSVIVFLPVVFNKTSEMNIRFREIGVTVCLTLLASLFISQTLIPLAMSWFIRSQPRPRERWLVWLEERYVRLLAFNLRRRWVAPLCAVVVMGVSYHPYQNVDVNFDSERRRMANHIRYRFSEETSLKDKEELISRVEAILMPHRDELALKSIYSYWRENHATTRLYPTDETATDEHLAAMRERVRELLPEFPGVRLEVTEERSSWRPYTGKRVAVQLRGEDPDVLARLAGDVRAQLNSIDGLSGSDTDDEEGSQELHVEIHRDLATRYDIPPEQVAETVGLTFRGRRLPRFRTPVGEREMRLTLEEKETESVSQLRNLPLHRADGRKIPLASLARFQPIDGPDRIRREDRLTSLWVAANYTEGTRNDYVPLVAEALESVAFPEGYYWTFGAWQEEHRALSAEFGVNLLLALLLVFAVMSSLFESVQRAVALMVALPFALAGAIWTLYLTGTDFDQPAAVGVLLLIGVVVNNGIVMIEHINAYQRQGLDRFEAMIRGGKERLRPILMTALTTLLGLVPIVVQRPSLGGMYYYSMALVLMGGMLISTFLTAILLPTTASLIEDGVTLVADGVRSLWRGRRSAPAAATAPVSSSGS